MALQLSKARSAPPAAAGGVDVRVTVTVRKTVTVGVGTSVGVGRSVGVGTAVGGRKLGVSSTCRAVRTLSEGAATAILVASGGVSEATPDVASDAASGGVTEAASGGVT